MTLKQILKIIEDTKIQYKWKGDFLYILPDEYVDLLVEGQIDNLTTEEKDEFIICFLKKDNENKVIINPLNKDNFYINTIEENKNISKLLIIKKRDKKTIKILSDIENKIIEIKNRKFSKFKKKLDGISFKNIDFLKGDNELLRELKSFFSYIKENDINFDFNESLNFNSTPLHETICYTNPKSFNYLLDIKEFDINHKNSNGETVLMLLLKLVYADSTNINLEEHKNMLINLLKKRGKEIDFELKNEFNGNKNVIDLINRLNSPLFSEIFYKYYNKIIENRKKENFTKLKETLKEPSLNDMNDEIMFL